LKVLAGCKLNTGPQCSLKAKTANSIQCCTGKSIASRSREVILPLSTGEATSGELCLVPDFPAQKRHVATKEIPVKGLEDD